MYIFDHEDHMIKTFGSHGLNHSQFRGPSGVCFDEDNFLYIAEQKGHREQKFDLDGYFILNFGGLGEHEGEIYRPLGITAHHDKVYVTDQHYFSISPYFSISHIW